MISIVFDCTLSSSVALLLYGTTVVGSGGFDEFLWVREDFKMLI